MPFSPFISRRSVSGALAVVALLVTPGQAAADPSDRPADCSAADVAGVAAGVTTALSAYLFTHPDVNGFYTGLEDRPKDRITGEVQNYFGANPQEEADLENIRQPMKDIRERCHWTPLLGQAGA